MSNVPASFNFSQIVDGDDQKMELLSSMLSKSYEQMATAVNTKGGIVFNDVAPVVTDLEEIGTTWIAADTKDGFLCTDLPTETTATWKQIT